MKFQVEPAPHIISARPVPQVMREVLYALIPAVVVYTWYFGAGLIVNVAIACAVALASEAAILRLRRRDVRLYLSDYSAVVTAALLAFALPSLTPWYVTVTGTLFAIVFAKHLYGGLGFNPFNPAMAGYVLLLIAFPTEMADLWIAPRGAGDGLSVGQTLAAIFASTPPAAGWDAITSATPLDQVQSDLSRAMTMSEINANPTMHGSIVGAWLWINLAVAAGGIYMLARGIIRWHIPLAVIAGLALMATLFYLADADRNPSPLFHLTTGATMLGAFFIATDPVSAATSLRGRLIYGFGIGVIAYIIRTWAAYPDGIAFAVLIMNVAVPAIDYFTIPKPYGARDD
ncbi:MAG: RnfABCDGE type electron transport complex subunit D [Gammaproteobacteria bacterium]|nr:RnfABCDGE type electron transport complex subunit D [Gammaproteobacteria bacterium]NNF60244.1 RnfABCDGE type electron transport complex subunit D [Gammaproteobacteria bacterium]NNM20352.1 RnfABCDGE type electron transport complex subunit D [Gammaproteobacteria bacterium]